MTPCKWVKWFGCYSLSKLSIFEMIKDGQFLLGAIHKGCSQNFAPFAPWGTTLRRSNFPLKSKKGREGESLALLQIWHSILGYLLGLIDLDNYTALLRTFRLTMTIKIRTSEDVRPSKKDKVWFYVLFATFLCYFTQPRILFLRFVHVLVL